MSEILKASLQANPSFFNMLKLKKLLERERLNNSSFIKASRAAHPTKFDNGGLVSKNQKKKCKYF